MFTLNLNEIELTPRIEEDKLFQNPDEIALEDEVLKYITEKYSATYKNPLTVGRKIRDAIRDSKGQNRDDKTKAYMAESDKHSEEFMAKYKKAEEEANKEFEPKRDELSNWSQQEKDKVYEEYQPKINAAEKEEDQKKLEEEMQLKLDDINYEHDQKFDTLMKDWNARINELKEQV